MKLTYLQEYKILTDHSFIHSFNNCLQITALDVGDEAVNNMVKAPAPVELLSMISNSILL